METSLPLNSLAIYNIRPRFGYIEKPGPVTATEIRLVSPKGEVQGILAADESGVQLKSADGQTRYSFDGDSFTMTRREKPVFALTTHDEGEHNGSNLSLFSSDGTPNAILGISAARREGFVQIGRTVLSPQEHHRYVQLRRFTPEPGVSPLHAIRKNGRPEREYTLGESLNAIGNIFSAAGFRLPLPVKF